ncbi:hypothetical protein K466DRAFT_660817 [Polyporus arcularius HHB13444]|uniref:Zn(2)-C6 fungal-type domain-containing protein n=1 Tax=Polyporus arcularius HHB13444 TaxID=1314778 RepID=A0A5C3PM69_9APHY|nr:hypothetical protein K466DRAFT_660817 [Polyporus arcularius HHB13444]
MKAVSKIIKRRGPRSQPKHSRGEAACARCASNKTKCTRSSTDPRGPCTKCIEKKHECVWPPERAGRACRQCRDAKIRCGHVRTQSAGRDGAEQAANDAPLHTEASPAYTPPPIAGPSNAAVVLNPGDEPARPHIPGAQPRLQLDTSMHAYDTPGTPPSVASSPRSDYWSVVLSDDSR